MRILWLVCVLEDARSKFWNLVEFFILQSFQIGCVFHCLLPDGYRGPFRRKEARAWSLHLVPRLRPGGAPPLPPTPPGVIVVLAEASGTLLSSQDKYLTLLLDSWVGGDSWHIKNCICHNNWGTVSHISGYIMLQIARFYVLTAASMTTGHDLSIFSGFRKILMLPSSVYVIKLRWTLHT